MIRCPHCDTFIKPASLNANSCPFCPSTKIAKQRNPVPGLVLAATIMVSPVAMGACSDDDPQPTPDAAQTADANTTPDAGTADASPLFDADPAAPDAAPGAPIYGIAPE